jgi:hypothetical protein
LLNEDGTCTAAAAEDGVNHDAVYASHGVIMWTCWCLISVIQVYTNRYLRHKWTWRQYLHSALGFFTIIATLTAALLVFWLADWVKGNSVHVNMGLSMVILGLLLCIGGIVTSIIKFKIPMAWSTRKKIMLSKFHGYFAYLLIIFA